MSSKSPEKPNKKTRNPTVLGKPAKLVSFLLLMDDYPKVEKFLSDERERTGYNVSLSEAIRKIVLEKVGSA